MFVRKNLMMIVVSILFCFTACTHPKPIKTADPVKPSTTIATPTPTATPLAQPSVDPRRDLLKNAEEENLKRWSEDDIRRAEEQLAKIEDRIRQTPDAKQTAFMQLVAQRLRESIVRAKELHRQGQSDTTQSIPPSKRF